MENYPEMSFLSISDENGPIWTVEDEISSHILTGIHHQPCDLTTQCNGITTMQCFFCGTTETPQLRHKHFYDLCIRACNACGLRADKGFNYCPGCTFLTLIDKEHIKSCVICPNENVKLINEIFVTFNKCHRFPYGKV